MQGRHILRTETKKRRLTKHFHDCFIIYKRLNFDFHSLLLYGNRVNLKAAKAVPPIILSKDEVLLRGLIERARLNPTLVALMAR